MVSLDNMPDVLFLIRDNLSKLSVNLSVQDLFEDKVGTS